jgi:hypothetical protein
MWPDGGPLPRIQGPLQVEDPRDVRPAPFTFNSSWPLNPNYLFVFFFGFLLLVAFGS